jgi:sugar/nucleoside kinase (ribokinase family)
VRVEDRSMTSQLLGTQRPLCVVGNVNRDVQVQGVPGTQRLLADGETSVTRIVETIGGGGANSACAAAALGAEVRFVGKVGADALGRQLRQALERHGVGARLACDQRTTTGTTVALGLSSGHRHFLSCLPNNESFTLADIDMTALDGCCHLLRADVWFSPAMLDGGNEQLFREARRRHLVTSLDINFDPCWSSGSADAIARRKQLLRQTLGLVDVAHGNVRELCEFTDSADLDTALTRLQNWGVQAVVVHLGAQGAGYYCHGQLVVEPPDLAHEPVHATGTGDVLSMCMILLHARSDLSIAQKLQLSNRVVREFMEGRRTMIPTL